MFHWCCYIIVDFATAESQNGFSTYKLSLHNKTNTFQKITKKYFIAFIYHRTFKNKIIIQHSTFVELCKNHFVMRPLQNPTLCSRTVSLLNWYWDCVGVWSITTIDAHWLTATRSVADSPFAPNTLSFHLEGVHMKYEA